MRRPLLIVVGSYNRDTLLRLSHMPAAGETIGGATISFGHGGKGSNQAIQAARHGAAVKLIAAVGMDDAGDAAMRLWSEEGIDCAAVRRRRDLATGTAVVMIEPSGENRIAVAPGANASLDEGDIADALDDDCAACLAQFEVPVEAIAAAFSLARAGSALTILNAAPMQVTAASQLAPLTDVLIVNRIEAAALIGSGMAGATEMAQALMRAGAAQRSVVVSDGAEGAVLANADGTMLQLPAPRIAVRDTTGAGDAFTGAFAAALVAGHPAAEALRAAIAAGSKACLTDGAITRRD